MYIYFNKSYEATTVIPHGEILRQGGDLNLYVCLDEKLDGNSFFVYVKNKDKTCERICSFVGYQEFRKLKDSEVTYDLVEGNKYYVYHAKFMPEESTCYSGKIGVSFEIDNVPTAAISLYVEKTFGYEIPNTNITQDQYLEIKELIRQIDAKKIELNSGILRKSLTYDFTADDKNRLFIDDNGNIFTVEIIDNNFSPVIIASGDYELKNFIEKEYQKKLVVDELPTENSKNLVTSDGVFKAIDEVPHVEVSKNSDNIMTSLTVDNEKVNLPTTSFDIEYEVENGKLILKSITFNGDKYNIKEYKEHEPVIVDSTISSNSLNPVQSRVLYQKFEEKVDKVPGKKLSANDFTDAYKNKLDNLEQISNKHNDDVNKLSGRITLLNTDLSNIKTKIENFDKIDGLDDLFEILENKVDKIEGKSLSTNDFTNEYKTKLDNLEKTEELDELFDIIDKKVDKVTGKGLSTNDYTTAEKNKLSGLNNYDDTEIKKSIAAIQKILTTDDTDFDTLQELVNVLKNNQSGISSIMTELSNKVDKVTGKGLSTNDFTATYKTKLDNLDTNLNNKVDKIEGKSLSTNDYTTTEKTKLYNLPTSTELTTLLNNKVTVVTGKGLSTNDFTDVYKNKLDNLETIINNAINAQVISILNTDVED